MASKEVSSRNRKGAVRARPSHEQNFFTWFAQETARQAGKPAAFLVALAIVIGWALAGPFFDYSDTWQLVINTSTTIATFLMVFLIQNTQNRDTLALQLKLSELILVARGAPNRLAVIEDMPDEELERLHDQFRRGGNRPGRPRDPQDKTKEERKKFAAEMIAGERASLHSLGRDLHDRPAQFGFRDGARGFPQRRQDVLDPLGDETIDLGMEEAFRPHVLEQGEQGVPVALQIQDRGRFAVPSELDPGQLLDQFLQRADAAGERGERIGALEHDALALVHVARDDHFARSLERALAGDQEIRNHANDLAACLRHRPCKRAHQSDAAAAIDELHFFACKNPPELAGGFDENRPLSHGRAAIDADALYFGH
jgi:low affinity Fe/Cu permease